MPFFIVDSIIIVFYAFAACFFSVLRDYNYHVIALCFCLFVPGVIYDRYTKVWSKPVVAVKAKVKKTERRCSTHRTDYYIMFLLADRTELRLHASKLQYKSVERGTVVDLVYQGELTRSIKRAVDEMPISCNDVFLKKRKKTKV